MSTRVEKPTCAKNRAGAALWVNVVTNVLFSFTNLADLNLTSRFLNNIRAVAEFFIGILCIFPLTNEMSLEILHWRCWLTGCLVLGLLICCLLKGFEQQIEFKFLQTWVLSVFWFARQDKACRKKVFAPANSASVVSGMIMLFLLAAPFRRWPGKQKSAP